MEKDKIILLLEKYWRAETTIEEERVVKQYFASHQPGNLTADSKWFKAIRGFQTIEPAAIDLPPIELAKKIKKYDRTLLLKVAAIFILILSIVFLGINYRNQKIQAEKDLAIQNEAEASLMSISKVLNQTKNDFDQSVSYILSFKKSNR